MLAGQDGAVQVTVELVGVSVCPETTVPVQVPDVSGFHTNGGGGVVVGVGLTLVQFVTDRVVCSPGLTVDEPEFVIAAGEQAGGGWRIPKLMLFWLGPTVTFIGFVLPALSWYPLGIDMVIE